jgi:chitodextrinase
LANAQSTVAFVQVNSATPQSAAAAVGVRYNAVQTPGDLNVVVVGWNDATAQVQSVVDSSGNSYSRAVGPTVRAGSGTQSIYYSANIRSAPAGANTVTVTFTTPANFADIRIAEYAGIATVNPVDVAVGASGSSTSSSSGIITTTNANDLVVGANLVQTMTNGPGTGFTSRVITSPDGDILEDQIVTTTGNYSASASVSAAGWWIMQVVAFRAASSGGDTQPPTAPGTPALSVVSNAQINLIWATATDNVGVTGYFVERCANAGCSSFAQVGTTATSSFNDTGLSASTSYTYRIRATDAAGNLGPYSGMATATTQAPADTQPPTAPGTPILTVVSSAQINLTWAAATDNVGVTGYLVERCVGAGCSSFSQIGAPTTTSFNDSGLNGSTSYTYRVRATDAVGNFGPYSATSSATTQGFTVALIQHASQDAGITTSSSLAFPSNTAAGHWIGVVIRAGQEGQTFTVTDTRSNTYQKAVQLDETSDGTTVAIYYAENISGGPTTVSVADSIGGGTLRFAIFEYAGLALSNSFDGAATGQGTSATPATGVATLASAGDLIIGALSTANPQTVAAGGGWTLEERVPVAPNTKLAVEDQIKPTAGSVSATATLSSSDSWGAVVAGFRAATSAADTQPPTSPGTPVLTAVSNSQINVTWAAATDNVGVTGYFVERCAGAGCSSFVQVGTSTTISLNDTGLTASTSYTYRVRATDAANNLGPYSTTATASTQAAPDTQPPTAPGNLVLTVVSGSQINLTWAAATDNVGVTGYFVERCASGGCSSFAQVGAPTTTGFSDTGLNGSTSYTYRVRATDAASNLGPYSPTATATTQATPDTQPPTAPGTPALSVVSSTQINVAWAAATDNVGVTGYFVERCAGVGCSSFAQVGAPTTTSFNDTGLTASTTYTYRVRATDAANNLGPYSVTVSATTQAPPDTQPPTSPGTPVLTVVSSGQINLTWTAATDNVGVTGYFVERCAGVGCSTFVQVGAPTMTSFNDSGLSASTSYTYRVCATDAANNVGPYSGTATTVTPVSITLVQHSSRDAGTTTSATLAFPANTNAGNFIAVAIRAGKTGQIFTVTDTAGDLYNKAVQLSLTNDSTTLAIYYAENINGGATTVSVSDSVNGGTLRFSIFEYAGLAQVNSLDGTATGQGTSATVTTGAATLASSGDLVIGALTSSSGRTFTAGAGWTLEEGVPGAPNTKLAVEDQISTSPGSVAGAATLSSSDSWGGVVAAFRSGGPPPDLALIKTHSGNFAQGQAGAIYTLRVSNIGSGPTSGSVTVTDTLPAGLSSPAASGPGWTCTTTPLACTRNDVLSPGTSYPDITVTVNVSAGTPSSITNTATVAGGGDVNAANNSASDITTVTNVPDTTPPSAPGTLTATPISGVQVDLIWGPATDNIGVAGYRVERCLGGGCTSFVKLATTTSTTFSDTGLTPNSNYTYVVRAVDAANNLGPYSNAANVTTLSNDPTLVLALAFDEGDGTTTADASGNKFSATVSNAAWTTAGRYGNALVFNGTNARVAVPDAAALHLTASLTLEAWVNPSATSPDWADIIYKANDNYYLEAGTSRSGAPAAGATAGGVNTNAFGSAALPTNTWTHIAETYDGSLLRLYVNGVQVASQPLTGSLATSTNPLEIGGDSLYGQFFQGTIDEVRVYNVALTPTQIQSDMATPLNAAPPQVSLSVSNLDFGSQDTGTTSGVQTVTLTNAGGASLLVTDVSVSGPNASDFGVNTTCVSTIAPGANCPVNVTFTPSVAGTRSATIVISDNAPGAPHTVSLAGVGGGFTISPRVAVLTSALTQAFSTTGGQSTSVTWSVDGVNGGNASTGTITSNGVYSPPPAAGAHVVTAIGNLSESSSATVYVTNYAGTFTHHNDGLRSGQNLSESVLTPSNVSVTTFGKLLSFPLDGVAIASPLYAANVTLPDATIHNVVFVATEHDSVYAFDADGRTAGPLWQTSFISPANGVTTVPADDTGECCDIAPEIGITGTPVIDPATGTLYVVAKTKEVSDATTSYVQRLHALDIRTGAEKFGGPVIIQASVPGLGQGTDGVNVPFDALQENQRPALLLSNGIIYIGFGSHGDVEPYHGWVLGYNATTLQQTMAFNVSPNGSGGGIWQANGGPAVDAAGNIYFVTGNGTFSADTGGSDYGSSFVKINAAGAVVDYFTPHDQDIISAANFDLGAAGPLLLPDQPGGHPHLIVSAGKNNTIYLVDRDSMGHYNASDDSQIVQSLVDIFPYGTPEPGNYSGAVYFNGQVYFGPIADNIQAFTLSNGLLSTSATSRSTEIYAYPGATMAISANGSANGILWAIERNGDCGTHAACSAAASGTLRAYDAANLTFQLYSSDQAPDDRDSLDFAAKFSVPLVANGKVFVTSTGQLTIFGLLP